MERMNFITPQQKGTLNLKIFIVDRSKAGWKRVSNLLDGVRNIELSGSDENDYEMVDDIEKLKPDVLILDIDMPVRKGIEFLQQIHSEHTFLAVIVFTDASCSFFRKKCLEAGAKFFFDKATEFHKVPQTIEFLLRDFPNSPN
jgi:DNA-binding NarL/FixJ family response regulator